MFSNAIHSAFNFKCSIQGKAFPVTSVACDTARFAKSLALKIPFVRLIKREGCDYVIVLQHRASGEHVTLVARNGNIEVGTSEKGETALSDDIALILGLAKTKRDAKPAKKKARKSA